MALAETFDCTERPVLRPGEDPERVCRDCFGALVIEDDDGSLSGTLGSLVDCICVELSVPPGFVECPDCAALIRITRSLAVHQAELVQEYRAFCAATGMEPAWCLRCGKYRPLNNGTRPPCGCIGLAEPPA
jgi:hypothetical protein